MCEINLLDTVERLIAMHNLVGSVKERKSD